MTDMLNGMPIDILLEAIVCVLLIATIGYCASLAKRLKAMRSGQDGLRKLIADLSSATGQASEAIMQLRVTTDATGLALNEQIKRARNLTEDLRVMVDGGTELAERLQRLDDRRQAAQTQAPRTVAPARPARAPLPIREAAPQPRIVPSAPAMTAPAAAVPLAPIRALVEREEGTTASELHSLINLLKRTQVRA